MELTHALRLTCAPTLPSVARAGARQVEALVRQIPSMVDLSAALWSARRRERLLAAFAAALRPQKPLPFFGPACSDFVRPQATVIP